MDSSIEDCFDAAAKDIVFDGKTFSASKDADRAKHFGKQTFAHKVVRPNSDTIDFTGFRPLLANLVAVIKSHQASFAAVGPATPAPAPADPLANGPGA